jgi:phosphate transport system permease protein
MSAIPSTIFRGGKRPFETVVKGFAFLCALVSILTTAGIFIILMSEASTLFAKVSLWDFLTGTEWAPNANPPKFGVLPLVNGTLLITLGSALISLPLGLLTAIYLSEYAPPKARKIIKPALELLAGVPTVVYGYFALMALTPFMQDVLKLDLKAYNALSGAIVVGIMTLPLVSSLCEDAISSVPKALREGAYGLGATRVEVIVKVVLPAALSGISAGFILAISRAVGETMAVTLAAGQMANLSFNIGEGMLTMTAFIVQMSKGDVARGTDAYQSIFAVGAALFLITLALNLLAQALVKKFRKVYA